MMSRIIRVIIQNSLHQNKNREDVNNREIRYLPDLSIFNLLSVFVLIQKKLNYSPNYPTHRLYFGEVETPYGSGCTALALSLSSVLVLCPLYLLIMRKVLLYLYNNYLELVLLYNYLKLFLLAFTNTWSRFICCLGDKCCSTYTTNYLELALLYNCLK